MLPPCRRCYQQSRPKAGVPDGPAANLQGSWGPCLLEPQHSPVQRGTGAALLHTRASELPAEWAPSRSSPGGLVVGAHVLWVVGGVACHAWAWTSAACQGHSPEVWPLLFSLRPGSASPLQQDLWLQRGGRVRVLRDLACPWLRAPWPAGAFPFLLGGLAARPGLLPLISLLVKVTAFPSARIRELGPAAAAYP